MSENAPFLGKVKVKNAAGGFNKLPPLKTAFDIAFLGMLGSLLLAGLFLYFRHKGITEKGVVTFVLFGISSFIVYFFSWWCFAALLPAFPLQRYKLAISLFIFASLLLALGTAFFFGLYSQIEIIKTFIDLDSNAKLPFLLSFLPMKEKLTQTAYLWFPFGLVIPFILALVFLNRTEPKFN